MASRCAFCQFNHYSPGVRILTPNGAHCIKLPFIPPSAPLYGLQRPPSPWEREYEDATVGSV